MSPYARERRAVNLLFLIVLLLQLSNALLLWLPQYVRLILNQALFVFLPAYLYLRITRQPIGERVRWRWPGGPVAGLSLLLGMGLYPLSAVSAGVLQQLLGYQFLVLPDDVIPRTALMGVLAIVAYAVMAPLCEEFLFRGVIQPVYERRSPTRAVMVVGLLFIMLHLSLLQSVSIVLLTLALGWINYRTRSLPASILTHVGANAMAALVLTNDVFNTGAPQLLLSPVSIGGGLGLALMAYVALLRLTRHPAPAAAREPRPAGRATLAAGWPLLLAGALYLGIIGVEFFTSRAPAPVNAPLHLPAADWDSAQTRRYEIRNAADDIVGEGECRLTPTADLIELTCTSTVRAYEVRIGNSYWSSAGGERVDTFVWQAADGRLLSGHTRQNLHAGAYRTTTRWERQAEGMAVVFEQENEPESRFFLPWSETPLAEAAALPIVTDFAAPWQLATLPLERGAGGQVARFNPYTWRPATEDSGPVLEQWPVTVLGREGISTPAGDFDAWRVAFGSRHTLWYAEASPALPVKFFNGIETWTLK